MTIVVGARNSRLAKLQVDEVLQILSSHHPNLHFERVWLSAPGDRDKTTPLWEVTQEDFFTKDIDVALIQGAIRIAVHSAKDLPKILRSELSLLALTEGLDPRDSFVMRPGASVQTLPQKARIGASSKRRAAITSVLRPDFCPVSIRGTIDERLALLRQRGVDGIIVAEAALLRLSLFSLNRVLLPYETDALQGKLAVVGLACDEEMARLFSQIDARQLPKPP